MAVLPFSNKTFKPGLEIRARDLVLRELSERDISLIAEKEAELTLKGCILDYSIEPVAFDARDISRQYRLNLTVCFSLEEKGNPDTIWEETFGASSYYFTGPNVVATEMAERKACDEVLQEISRFVAVRVAQIY